MTPKDRWLSEGMSVLSEEGIGGVRVDRIAARLELTKGSFHHHFNGVSDYRRSLLERYELEVIGIIEETKLAVRDLPPERVLLELPARAPFNPWLEAAIRGWASQDPDAREVLQRVDAARLESLTDLWQAIAGDPDRARTAALIPHLVMIGASVALPAPTESDMGAVFALLAHLAPFVTE